MLKRTTKVDGEEKDSIGIDKRSMEMVKNRMEGLINKEMIKRILSMLEEAPKSKLTTALQYRLFALEAAVGEGGTTVYGGVMEDETSISALLIPTADGLWDKALSVMYTIKPSEYFTDVEGKPIALGEALIITPNLTAWEPSFEDKETFNHFIVGVKEAIAHAFLLEKGQDLWALSELLDMLKDKEKAEALKNLLAYAPRLLEIVKSYERDWELLSPDLSSDGEV